MFTKQVFHCIGCGKETKGFIAPHGWHYEVAIWSEDYKTKQMLFFCSKECLAAWIGKEIGLEMER